MAKWTHWKKTNTELKKLNNLPKATGERHTNAHPIHIADPQILWKHVSHRKAKAFMYTG